METNFITISASNGGIDIPVIPVNDEITLEYDDRVLLRFTSAVTNLFSDLANQFEYIRDTAVVNIIDNDRKHPFFIICLYKKCVSLQFLKSILRSLIMPLRRGQTHHAYQSSYSSGKTRIHSQ